MNRIICIIAIIIYALSICGNSQDISDAQIRENPNITIDSVSTFITYNNYTYLNLSNNRINYNGSDWCNFYANLIQAKDSSISIVHIGDSHIQADIATGCTRKLLQAQLGNAGRGIIIPFKMAKTNEPRDYSITSKSKWASSKAVKYKWEYPMGFTGISITPLNHIFDLTINTQTKTTSEPFSSVRIFHNNSNIKVDSIFNKSIENIKYFEKYFDINLCDTTTLFSLKLSAEDNLSIFGIALGNVTPGITYHAIGNNGATFETYNRIGNIGKDISSLNPSLVIISLGANEAFSNITTAAFYQSMHTLVTDIKDSNPNAEILLVTPMECHKRRYIRRKGRRRRKTYVVNEKILALRDQIIKYGEENKIAVYDWYDVAGGKGASNKWIKDNLMGRDHIHNTVAGYEIQGTLLYEALIKDAFSTNKICTYGNTNTMDDDNI